MFFNNNKQDRLCGFLEGQQKINLLQEDILRLTRDIRTLYEALNETQSTCTLLMDALSQNANLKRSQP